MTSTTSGWSNPAEAASTATCHARFEAPGEREPLRAQRASPATQCCLQDATFDLANGLGSRLLQTRCHSWCYQAQASCPRLRFLYFRSFDILTKRKKPYRTPSQTSVSAETMQCSSMRNQTVGNYCNCNNKGERRLICDSSTRQRAQHTQHGQ